jgi:hypothetical protein
MRWRSLGDRFDRFVEALVALLKWGRTALFLQTWRSKTPDFQESARAASENQLDSAKSVFSVQ